MKRTSVVQCVALIMGMGLSAPGCFLWPGDDKNEGRFCASPIEGGTYCVSASSQPLGAWSDAAAHGHEPIQMWAEWPENVELREVVASPALLNAWLGDVRTVMDYLRVTQGNAESYQASLSGNLGERLRQARRVQNNIISDKSVDPKKRLEQVLLDKAITETDPLKAEITADKQSMGDVLAIVEQTKVDGA